MLFELYVKNYALIDELTVQFDGGFNVITGETGVGKSILIDALSLCLGMRGNKDAVRKGKNKMLVQALFQMDSPRDNIISYLNELGIEESDSIILTREVYENGKSIGRINGSMVNINNLKEIGMMLVDIHSQREHQTLLDKNNHLIILDSYIGLSHKEKLDKIHDLFNKYTQLVKKRESLLHQEQQLNREKDLYEFQLKELNDLDIYDGEDIDLEQQLKILNNSEMIYNQSHQAYDLLYNSELSAYNQLALSIDSIFKIVSIDTSVNDTYDQLNNALVMIEDASHTLRDYKDNLQFDDDMLNEINIKINKINNLKRKYGPEITDIKNYKKNVIEKLEMIDNKDEVINEMNKEIEEHKNKYIELAREISMARREASLKFAQGITEELKDLAMSKSKFFVKISSDDNVIQSTGLDRVEFYIITNEGEVEKPLIKIASGGELSRVILAIKSIINTSDYINTLIFDEIDTGISGRTAQKVAQKIKNIGNKKQVICITHLPQIASMADCHFNVIKENKNDETFTLFRKLSFEERCIELARMTSGKVITETSIQHAKEMLSMNGKNN